MNSFKVTRTGIGNILGTIVLNPDPETLDTFIPFTVKFGRESQGMDLQPLVDAARWLAETEGNPHITGVCLASGLTISKLPR